MKRHYNLSYYFSEGFHSIFTHGLMSFAAVFMIVACLIIMGSFSLVALNLENKLGDLERDNEFLAFVDENYSREDALALQTGAEAGGPPVVQALAQRPRKALLAAVGVLESLRSAAGFNVGAGHLCGALCAGLSQAGL